MSKDIKSKDEKSFNIKVPPKLVWPKGSEKQRRIKRLKLPSSWKKEILEDPVSGDWYLIHRWPKPAVGESVTDTLNPNFESTEDTQTAAPSSAASSATGRVAEKGAQTGNKDSSAKTQSKKRKVATENEEESEQIDSDEDSSADEPQTPERVLERVSDEHAKHTIAVLVLGDGKALKPALTNSQGCVLVQNKPSETRYVKCKIRGTGWRTEVFVHRLSYRVSQGLWSWLRLATYSSEVIHHRCGNVRCIRPSHLAQVDRTLNDQMVCNQSGFELSADGLNPCQHTPQCILPPSAASRNQQECITESMMHTLDIEFGFRLSNHV